MRSDHPFGVFVGRLNPIHLGHERNIRHMLEVCGNQNCLVVIGSSNAPMSLRHFFNYRERRSFIKTLFSNLKLAGLPDYNSDEDWMMALDDLISLTGADPTTATFFSGSEEDGRFFLAAKRQVEFVNRFEGPAAKISATEVRDLLIRDQPVDHLINPKIAPQITKLFKTKWEAFRQS